MMRTNLCSVLLLIWVSGNSGKGLTYGLQSKDKESQMIVDKNDALKTFLLHKHFPMGKKEKKLMPNVFKKVGSLFDSSLSAYSKIDDRQDKNEKNYVDEQYKDVSGERGVKKTKGKDGYKKRVDLKKYPKNQNFLHLHQFINPSDINQHYNHGIVGDISEPVSKVIEKRGGDHLHVSNGFSPGVLSYSSNHKMQSESPIINGKSNLNTGHFDLGFRKANFPKESDKKKVESSLRLQVGLDTNTTSVQNAETIPLTVRKAPISSLSSILEGGVGHQTEGDWKFHFKQRDAEEDNDGHEVYHLEKRDTSVKKTDGEADWKSHVGDTAQNMHALTLNVTDESGGNQSAPLNRSELAKDGQETTTEQAEEEKPAELPPKGAAEEEHHSSLTIFFILLVVAISILVVHLLIQTKFHYLPDSIAIVLIGAFIGLFLKLFKFGNWKNEEAFPPTVFFIVLLPPIIFEGGYNLHKGNFFHNIGSIMVFAVIGTFISAMIVGGGIYLLGQAEVVYQFNLVESFAFGSLISAVDPVATLAIFQALDVDPILYMLVFGESMLNDAVSIVLTTTVLEFASPSAVVTSGAAAFFQAVARFSFMFFGSAAIGVFFGLVSAMMTKFFDFHKTPSLEVGMVFAFSYLPYALAEGIHLSGIMAILFCGIVMSHYTHLNLSPISQITVQQTFRTIAFIAETCVFAYLGLAIFSFKVNVKPAFTIWSIILILIGRAANIFPLSFFMNFFREHKITRKNQFIMWFSGLRGAVAFALSLHMGLENQDKQYVLVTTTLILVLFTIVFLGGSTMPLLKFLQSSDKKYKKKKKHDGEISMSKTKEMGDAIDSEHLSELTEEDESHVIRHHVKGFLKLDTRYLIPFFTKRFTQQEMREGRSQVDLLAKQWQMEVRAVPSETDGEEDSNTEVMAETSLMSNGNGDNGTSNGGRLSWS